MFNSPGQTCTVSNICARNERLAMGQHCFSPKMNCAQTYESLLSKNAKHFLATVNKSRRSRRDFFCAQRHEPEVFGIRTVWLGKPVQQNTQCLCCKK